MPDPGHYVDPEHHSFEQRFIRKFAEKEDIDGVVAEKFDMYWNFMVWRNSQRPFQFAKKVSGVNCTMMCPGSRPPDILKAKVFQ